MDISVFDYKDYRAYLHAWLGSQPAGGRGVQIRLARALRCHSTYVTFIFKNKADMSPEQAEAFGEFAGHTSTEKHYFLLLVQLARAGSAGLKSMLNQNVAEKQREHFDLQRRLPESTTLAREEQVIYYSSWRYAAVHMAVAVSSLRTVEAITEELGIPSSVVREILAFLMRVQLVSSDAEGYRIGLAKLHLEKESPLITQHHRNWRMQAINSLESRRHENLHYTSIVSMAKSDEIRVRAVLVRAIEDIRNVVKNSKEEGIFSYLIDFFPVRQER